MAKCATCGKSLNATIPGLLALHAHCSICGAPICYECDAGRNADLPPVCKSCLDDINQINCSASPYQPSLFDDDECNNTPDDEMSPDSILDMVDRMHAMYTQVMDKLTQMRK